MSRLNDPGLAEDSLGQMVFTLFESAGLAFVVSGPWDLADTASAVRSVSTLFTQSQPLVNGLGAHPAHQSTWAGVDGPNGSAVILFIAPGTSGKQALTGLKELQQVEGRWKVTMVNSGELDDLAATHLAGANAVPAREYLGTGG